MRNSFLALCILCASAAFAQIGSLGSGNQYQGHPEHADYAAMAQERTVLPATNYYIAHGERPASDFPQPPQSHGIALGTAARELRKQHEGQKKSQFIWVN